MQPGSALKQTGKPVHIPTTRRFTSAPYRTGPLPVTDVRHFDPNAKPHNPPPVAHVGQTLETTRKE